MVEVRVGAALVGGRALDDRVRVVGAVDGVAVVGRVLGAGVLGGSVLGDVAVDVADAAVAEGSSSDGCAAQPATPSNAVSAAMILRGSMGRSSDLPAGAAMGFGPGWPKPDLHGRLLW